MLKELYIFNENKEIFKRKLKEEMKKNKYSKKKLMEALDNTYVIETIKKWCSGSRIPDLATIKKLSNLFNISMEELLLPEASFKSENDYYIIDMNKSFFINEVFFVNSFFPDCKNVEYLYADDGTKLTISNFGLNHFTEESLKNQIDFKEYINYLQQKKLFSYLNLGEEERLKYIMETFFINSKTSQKVIYDEFWNAIENSLCEHYGVSYRLKLSTEEMKMIYYYFKKQLEFSNEDGIVQWQYIIAVLVRLDIKKAALFLRQFDHDMINLIYTSMLHDKKNYKKIINLLKENDAKDLKIRFDSEDVEYEVFQNVIKYYNSINYEKYMSLVNGG